MNDKYLAPDSLIANRYVIVRLLAEGGMGTVYEARDLRLGGTVALKRTIFTDNYLKKQFEREARLLANLRHMGLPKVIDHFITDEGGQFLAMEFIPGKDLKSLLDERERAFPYTVVLEWCDQLLDVLQYLHSRSTPVYHRDIKPQNLKLNDGIIILLDFGLAKGGVPDMTHLNTGSTVLGGTPGYAPLEQLIRIDQYAHRATSVLNTARLLNTAGLDQVMRQYTDARADLYSLAATIYHLITGIAPTNAMERFLSTKQGQPDPLQSANTVRRDVPLQVATFLIQAMAIERERRFANAMAMRKALHEIMGLADTVISNNIKDAKPSQQAEVSVQPPSRALKLKPVPPPQKAAAGTGGTVRLDTVKLKVAKRSQESKALDQSSKKALKLKPVASPKKDATKAGGAVGMGTVKLKAVKVNHTPSSRKNKG
jgi:serine/threonine protein kinase